MFIEHSSVSMKAEHTISETHDVYSSISGAEFSKHVSAVKSESLAVSMSQTSVSMQQLEQDAISRIFPAGLSKGLDGQYQVNMPDPLLDNHSEFNTQQHHLSLLQSLIDAIMAAHNSDKDPQAFDNSLFAVKDENDVAPVATDSAHGITRTLDLTVNFKMTIEEYEYSGFEASGMIRTSDGRTLDMNLKLNMERSYSETVEYQRSERIVFQDPLILNFNGDYAELTDDKYEFDLDMDGENELISYLSEQSAMLSLDKNHDGIINDGSELFGAATGNGFAELAQYDEDGNGYIDEADSIFSELTLWHKSLDGESLTGLMDNDVGAIYLGSQETPFALKGEQNQVNGQVKETGYYVAESGGVGTVQEIDMAVKA